jgi:hypothetical protein
MNVVSMRASSITHWSVTGLLVIGTLGSAGCVKRPSPIPVLQIDPSEASRQAIELYDTDRSGMISKAEAAGCPGFLRSWGNIDKDHDNSLSQEELQQRIAFWVDSPTRVVPLVCRVKLDGRPLEGAEIRFVPEPFMTTAAHEGTGITSAKGTTMPNLQMDDAAEDLKNLPGVRLGVYRIRVTHPDKTIPEKYNSKSVLGCEVVPGMNDFPVEFNLQSI